MHLRPFGRHALLAEVDDARAALDLATWSRHRGVEATEVVPAARTVLFDGVADLATLGAALEAWRPSGEEVAGDLVEVPVVYDGPDLAFVAQHWGMDPDAAVRTHAGLEFVAAFCGFAPGFSYLAGLPDRLVVPRLESPRSRVPAGSVGLADGWCGVYPTPSPGGWQLIGHTEVVLWDATRPDPALLPPGTRVRFVPA